MTTLLPVSIVIPILDDKRALEATVSSLSRDWSPSQIVISDGGSSDGGPQWARSMGLTVVESGRAQRAHQMNAGAAAVEAGILFFLHADTVPPADSARLIAVAISQGAVGGAFERRFDSDSLLLRITCRLAALRCRIWGSFLGDQGIFVRRDVFDRVGGFPDWDRMEDLGFSRRMRREGRVALLRPPVISSARRFARRGPFLQSLSDAGALLAFAPRGPAKEFRKDSRGSASKRM